MASSPLPPSCHRTTKQGQLTAGTTCCRWTEEEPGWQVSRAAVAAGGFPFSHCRCHHTDLQAEEARDSGGSRVCVKMGCPGLPLPPRRLSCLSLQPPSLGPECSSRAGGVCENGKPLAIALCSAHLLAHPPTWLSLHPPAASCPCGELATGSCPVATWWR